MMWKALLAFAALSEALPKNTFERQVLQARQGGTTMLRFGCTQVVIDRLDPLVNAGQVPSTHMHQIVGGNAFNASMATGDVSEKSSHHFRPQDGAAIDLKPLHQARRPSQSSRVQIRSWQLQNTDELREKLESIRFANTNWEERHFIPNDELFDVISESAIKLALRSSAVPLHEIIDLTDGILRGARRCFAILVFIRHGEAISSFFRHDSLRSHPDDRIPYTSEALQQIFEKDAANLMIRNFLEKQ
ncbi:hypothetical protein QBC40DRAFT_352225 [Triangularia verruculosa]|uniref:DUF1996 domain-containing protein n=1 Tax=Triangularia verruculosa TaxID=2587418 RepID=A0AAN6X8L2_9PEZI|nr:hypothetical protein QBC40DRAFT_352225 [Triangularia verruculosa]